MILDCRRSDCHFADPKPIKLATGEAMARIVLQPNQQLYTASADLQNRLLHHGDALAAEALFGFEED